MSVGKVVLLLCYTCKQWWTKGWGARGKAERGHLMTSPYSANRDKTF